MMKCPNCGSSAQFKMIDFMNCKDEKIEQYRCGCGATAEVIYKKVETIFRTADGTKI